jgi:hypothetical protein
MTVFVRYQVPVLARIDIESGQVVRVHVDDEAIGDAQDVFVTDGPELSREQREGAVEVASREQWPAWEFGG